MTDVFDITSDVVGKVLIRDETGRNGLHIQLENVPVVHIPHLMREAAAAVGIKPVRIGNRDEITPQLVLDCLLRAKGAWLSRQALVKAIIPDYATVIATSPNNARLLRNRISNCIDQFRRAQEAKEGQPRRDGRTIGATYGALLLACDFQDRKSPTSGREREYRAVRA